MPGLSEKLLSLYWLLAHLESLPLLHKSTRFLAWGRDFSYPIRGLSDYVIEPLPK